MVNESISAPRKDTFIVKIKSTSRVLGWVFLIIALLLWFATDGANPVRFESGSFYMNYAGNAFTVALLLLYLDSSIKLVNTGKPLYIHFLYTIFLTTLTVGGYVFTFNVLSKF